MSSSLSYVSDAHLPEQRNQEAASFATILLDAFHRNSERTAFIHAAGAITYADVLDRTIRLARALESRGLGRGVGVAAIDDNTPGILLTYLASKLLGCYFVGIPSHVGPSEQARILEGTEVSALVYEPALSGDRALDLADRRSSPIFLALGPGPVGVDLLALAAEQDTTAFSPAMRDDDLADLVLTGGSTGGRPKAAVYTFERLGALARAWLAISDQDTAEARAFRNPECRLLRFVKATISPGVAVLPTLLNGGALLLQQGFDAGAALRAIEEQRITVLAVYPSHLYQLLDHPDVTRVDLSSLRLVVYFGAPMSPSRLEEAIRVFGPVFCQIYGQSETRMLCSLQPDEHDVSRPESLRSVGRPRPGVDLEIRTALGIAAPGEIGEICVRGPYGMNHYWRDPALTAETVVDGWTRTGDLGYQDADGYLYLADRLKDMVIVNAINCFTVDIENALTSHPAVREAVVVGLPDPLSGEAVHAAVVRHPDREVTEDELREFVRTELGNYEAPKTVLFLDEIPVTRAGKPGKNVVRHLLSERLRSISPAD